MAEPRGRASCLTMLRMFDAASSFAVPVIVGAFAYGCFEPVRIGRSVNRGRCAECGYALDGLPDHGGRTQDRQGLLGTVLPGQGPEAGATAPGHDHRGEVLHEGRLYQR